MNKILKKQADLQKLLSTDENSVVHTGVLCDNILRHARYLDQEIIELVEEIAGSRDILKPWKQDFCSVYAKPIVITDKVRSEAIDVLKFALNICLMAGITPENIDEEFEKVNQRCIDRYNNGY